MGLKARTRCRFRCVFPWIIEPCGKPAPHRVDLRKEDPDIARARYPGLNGVVRLCEKHKNGFVPSPLLLEIPGKGFVDLADWIDDEVWPTVAIEED